MWHSPPLSEKAESGGRNRIQLPEPKDNHNTMSSITVNPNINLKDYQLHDKDTGSSDYQAAALTKRILHLTAHLATNKKDFSSRRGLLRAVAERRRHLDYLRNTAEERYTKLIKSLGLRR